MRLSGGTNRHCARSRHSEGRVGQWPWWMRAWVSSWTVLTGLLALVWVVLRSGTKPSRLAYPCQQAAAGTAVAAFGVPAVAAVIVARRRILALLRTRAGKVCAGAAVACSVSWFAVASFDGQESVAILTPPVDYAPEVFLVNDARGVEPGRFGGVDDLVSLMGMNGLKWHRSVSEGLTSGPTGLIDADDVVLLKINAQWTERGGTNTDVLRGVIRRVVEHPDGFTGEVIVADNGQGLGSFTNTWNNAEDKSQSTLDVVTEFVNEGWHVSTELWDNIRGNSVGEYDTGDGFDGYVVAAVQDPQSLIRVSYPKFQSAEGAFVSYKHGIWLPGLPTGTYDPGKLVVINMPVLKTHGIYAVTASVKNHMGVVTMDWLLGTDSHNGVGRGGLGSLMAEVRRPDLTILDCIWILARPGNGPYAAYADASRRDQLVAGTDPVALDVWAVKNILIPQIIANGYGYSSYAGTQNPDNPTSVFRNYLDKSMNELLLGGIDTTNDYNSVVLREWVDPAIPTVSQWGVAAMGLLLLAAGTVTVRGARLRASLSAG